MSAADPLKRVPGQRQRFRTVESADPAAENGPSPSRRPAGLKCTYRPPDADFYCWKYGVWYNVMDCCYRHDRRTYPGCADCGQGEMNLRQHQESFRLIRRCSAPVSPRPMGFGLW